MYIQLHITNINFVGDVLETNIIGDKCELFTLLVHDNQSRKLDNIR